MRGRGSEAVAEPAAEALYPIVYLDALMVEGARRRPRCKQAIYVVPGST